MMKNKEKIEKTINDIYKKNTKSSTSADTYSTVEKDRIRNYVNASSSSKSGIQEFIESLKELKKKITDRYKTSEDVIIEIAKKNATNTIIKKKVLDYLKPTRIDTSDSTRSFSDDVESIIQQIEADTKIMKSNFPPLSTSTGGYRRGSTTIGGAHSENRFKITESIRNLKIRIGGFKQICILLNNTINRLTAISGSTNIGSTTGSDSIFSKLYEQYITEKEAVEEQNNDGFAAAFNLIDKLKVNDLHPDDVLDIDMRDKFVFIAATLFIRIIAITIINIIIQRKIISRMDTALFWYGVSVSLMLILFVFVVNYDSYKLRIIFNYVNFHIGYSTFISYLFQLWIFGGIVYYLMLNINDNVVSSATNDEERARLKHKVQVVSMITWIFLSIGVLVM